MLHLPIITKKQPIPAVVLEAIETGVIFIVCFSGGKDSIAQTLYLLELGANIELHYHKVGNLFDWSCTESYVKAFAKAFNLPLYISYREGGLIREVYRENEGLQDVLYQAIPGGEFIRLKSKKSNTTKRKFPAVNADLRTRWCSSTQKIDVLKRVIANNPKFNEGRFIVCTGERKQESAKRSTYEDIIDHATKSKKREVYQWRPVLGWSEHEVWNIIEKYKVQPHPAYELGWSRCSCELCIFGSPNTWASLADLDPEKVLILDAHEQELSHTIYMKGSGKKATPVSILDKAAAGKSFLIDANVKRWQKEATSVFNSPIMVENWKTPQGAYSTESSGSN